MKPREYRGRARFFAISKVPGQWRARLNVTPRAIVRIAAVFYAYPRSFSRMRPMRGGLFYLRDARSVRDADIETRRKIAEMSALTP